MFCILSRAASVVLCLALSLLALSPSYAEQVKLNNQSLTLQIDTQRGAITQWHPASLSAQHTSAHDFAQLSRRLFQLSGSLAGLSLEDMADQTGGWQVVEQSSTHIHIALQTTDKGIALHQAWSLDEQHPWQANYRIWLTGKTEKLDQKLWIELGPGLGETPAQGLGMAQDLYSFTQAVSAVDDTVTRVILNQAAEEAEHTGSFAWVGLQSRYFAFIAAPLNAALPAWHVSTPANSTHFPEHPSFETLVRIDLPILSSKTEPLQIQLFGGAKSYPVLEKTQPTLDSLLFSDLWSWMRKLTIGLMHVLNALFAVIGNWGAAILLLAVVVRLLIHPIAKRAMASQRKFVALQEKIQPELKEIKRNYKGGEQSEMILQLYEKHGTSPFAGLKPMLIVLLQIPIFVALYHLLGQHFELRDQAFLWIDSLAEPDQLFNLGVDLPFFGSYFNLLPALMALTTLASIKLSPAPAADGNASLRQSMMLIVMTLGFFLLFYSFPSGMVLYWTAANLLHLLHSLSAKYMLR